MGAHGAATVSLAYGPDRWARLAVAISAAALIAMAGLVVGKTIRRRRARRTETVVA